MGGSEDGRRRERERSPGDRPSMRLRAVGAAALATVFALSFVIPPAGIGRSFCAFRNAFGIPCPGCGLTRSFAAVSHGLFGTAVGMHPMGPVMYLVSGLYAVKWTAEVLVRRPLLTRIEDNVRLPFLWGMLGAFVVVWVLRLATGAWV